MDAYMITFQEHGDERGMLVALEYEKECPFPIKRVYYMYDTKKSVRRGYHAHRKVVLDTPQKGLYLGKGIWREMYDFSTDAVLMSLASELYDETDYIRDYQQFIAERKGNI